MTAPLLAPSRIVRLKLAQSNVRGNSILTESRKVRFYVTHSRLSLQLVYELFSFMIQPRKVIKFSLVESLACGQLAVN